MDKIRIVALGGLDEHYKDCYVVEINDDIFVVQCGIKFPDIAKPGIDYVIPRTDYLVENKDRIRAYIITHGHDSVSCAIPYIYHKVPAPIYCTSITKTFLISFLKHNHIKVDSFVFNIVEPSDEITINNRKISLFSTCTNIAKSFGIAFDTDQGNIVFLSNSVFDNNADVGFTLDFSKVAKIAARKPTLLLMQDSTYAERPGYTNPNYKIIPLIDRTLRDASGRIFIGIESPDIYNIIAVINEAIHNNRKIIFYDQSTADVINCLIESNCLSIPKNMIVPVGEANRIRAQELMIIICSFEERLYRKIRLLAEHQNDDQILQVLPNDTFIFATHGNKDIEKDRTDALNELYHTDCKIFTFKDSEFIKMHASQEDLKTSIAIFKPRYYLPIQGTFVQLLANAKIALGTHVGLNHNSVFILENGDALEIENYMARIKPKAVLAGSVLIDGIGIGDIASNVLEERQRLSDDGVVILAATISKNKREIVLGPDIQSRGLVYVKENDALMKEIERVFLLNVRQELVKPNYSLSYLENNIRESVFKAIRRITLKSPTIIAKVVEID